MLQAGSVKRCYPTRSVEKLLLNMLQIGVAISMVDSPNGMGLVVCC